MRKISFVIPCYNSEKTIEGVIKEIETVITEKGKDDYEIVLVNDCSKDLVWNKIKGIAKENSKVKGVCFAKNFGQHAALMAGYRKADQPLFFVAAVLQKESGIHRSPGGRQDPSCDGVWQKVL